MQRCHAKMQCIQSRNRKRKPESESENGTAFGNLNQKRKRNQDQKTKQSRNRLRILAPLCMCVCVCVWVCGCVCSIWSAPLAFGSEYLVSTSRRYGPGILRTRCPRWDSIRSSPLAWDLEKLKTSKSCSLKASNLRLLRRQNYLSPWVEVVVRPKEPGDKTPLNPVHFLITEKSSRGI